MAYVEYIIKDEFGMPYEQKFIFDSDGDLMRQIDFDYFMDVEEMADYVLTELTDDDIDALKSIPFDDLIQLHHDVGRTIRNAFGLWLDGHPHVPVDADETSMDVIKLMWNKAMNNQPTSGAKSQVMIF
jgi:hypothetical protein